MMTPMALGKHMVHERAPVFALRALQKSSVPDCGFVQVIAVLSSSVGHATTIQG